MQNAFQNVNSRADNVNSSAYESINGWTWHLFPMTCETISTQKGTPNYKSDNPSGDTPYAWTGDVNCLANAVGISFQWEKNLEEKWWGGISVCMSLRDFSISQYHFELIRWEQDSTLWFHFSVLKGLYHLNVNVKGTLDSLSTLL